MSSYELKFLILFAIGATKMWNNYGAVYLININNYGAIYLFNINNGTKNYHTFCGHQ